MLSQFTLWLTSSFALLFQPSLPHRLIGFPSAWW